MKEQITTYYCDKCERELNETSQCVNYGNSFIEVCVRITRQVEGVISHKESMLCNKCKIEILERSIKELKEQEDME